MTAQFERPIVAPMPVSGDGLAEVRAMLKAKLSKSAADDRAINGSLWERVTE